MKRRRTRPFQKHPTAVGPFPDIDLAVAAGGSVFRRLRRPRPIADPQTLPMAPSDGSVSGNVRVSRPPQAHAEAQDDPESPTERP